MDKETEKTKMTKEELAKKWKEYYDWLQSIYPVESFEIQGKDGEMLHFYHGFKTKSLDDEHFLSYFLRDDEYSKYFKEQKNLHLQGEEMPEDEKKEYKAKGFISIDKNKKYFNFGIEWDYQGHGYGKAIYDNISYILEMLGIEDKEQYELRVYGDPNHDFFERMDTQRLVAKTNSEPNTENALQIIEEFSKYPNSMKFSELNTIIQYAINSNVPMEDIARAINDNGFNIYYHTVDRVPYFQEEDFEKFKSFCITGIKTTCMHHHFMRARNFGFIKLLTGVDTHDATLEFRRVLEEAKDEQEKRKTERNYIPTNLEKFGELEYLILDWNLGLLLQNIDPDIQAIVKKQAISKFDEFDPEHYHQWGFEIDCESYRTFAMLRDAGLMDKDVYIELYQKALNRNYNLQEFDGVISKFIDSKERELAKEEISQNVYYPSPKRNWQRSHTYGKDHIISKVEIPQGISEKGKVRDILKQEILKQGIARKTKIKTDMTGIGKDGKPFVVDNLKDWLFGVPGTHGNLQMMGTSAVTFPPQTPKFAIDLIKQTFKDLEYSDPDERE